MAEIRVNLEAQSREFAASLEQATRHVNVLAAQIQTLSNAQARQAAAATQAARAQNQATQATNQAAQATARQSRAHESSASSIGRAVVAYQFLYDVAKKTFGILQEGFTAAVTNIDDFLKASIGTAAAITNIADQSANAGKTWDQLFLQNLKATKQTFFELEKLAARYFASSTDLQLAYNAFAQRGVVIRKTELEQLAQLTDLILLLTQGQQSSIQVQEEIRSLINGTIRPTAQLGQLLKSYGKDVKQVAAEIKATQSLTPLEDILRGAAAATGEIQKTFTAAKNGFETTLRQIGRFGFEQFYAQFVNGIDNLTKFLQANAVQIAGMFGAIGAGTSAILDKLSTAVQKMLQFGVTSKNSITTFDNFIAGVVTAVDVIIRSVQVMIGLFQELPAIFKAAGRAWDIAFTNDDRVREAKKQRDQIVDLIEQQEKRVAEIEARKKSGDTGVTNEVLDAQKNILFDMQSRLSQLNKAIRANEKPLITLTETLLDGFVNLPWSKGVKEFGKTAEEVIDRVQKRLEPLTKFDIRGAFAANLQQVVGGRLTAEGVAEAAKKQETQVSSRISRKFTPDPEDVKKLEHATNALTAAQDRYARSVRSSDAVQVAAKTDLALQELRRTLALVEQGFLLVDGEINGLLSPAKEIGKFFSDNATAIAMGDLSLSTKDLKNNLMEIQRSIQGGIFTNLAAQLDVVRQGFETFKNTAKQAAQGLIATEVTTKLKEGAKIREEVEATFQKQVESADKLLAKAQEEVKLAKQSGDAVRIANAEKNLGEEEYLHRQALERAGQEKVYELQKAIATEEQGRVNFKRIIAQMDAQIAEQQKRLGAEELRILQAQNAEVGKLLQNTAKLAEQSGRRLVAEKAKAPRTDLQAAGDEIKQAEVQFAAETAQVEGSIAAIEDRLRNLGIAATQADIQMLTTEKDKLAALNATNAATLEQMRINRDFAVSWATVGNAVQSSLNTVVDSILASFEGKKTNFAQAFKGIADQMVKDSLKNVFQSITNMFQKGFESLTKTIAPGLESTLGPAFLAGFGLIASFVLGQLMGDKGGSGSAANPTVGIQSTEQVRGLIGGETQIPIGLVGESLQDALVPTNMWLSRIYSAITSAGGLSAAQVESIIERSVNDALQIQPA